MEYLTSHFDQLTPEQKDEIILVLEIGRRMINLFPTIWEAKLREFGLMKVNPPIPRKTMDKYVQLIKERFEDLRLVQESSEPGDEGRSSLPN